MIPVLLLAYKRPLLTQLNLQNLLHAGVTEIMVNIDGPKTVHDASNVTQVINICERFQREFKSMTITATNENLGCRQSVFMSVSKFLDHYNFGVIVEDDILITKKFLEFTLDIRELNLRKSNVWHINSWTPIQFGETDVESWQSSYISSWGWATWRNRWEQFNPTNFSTYVGEFEERMNEVSRAYAFPKRVLRYWSEVLGAAREKGVDSWAYPWQVYIWLNRGFAVTPNVRLSWNFGIGENATHTFGGPERLSRPPQPIGFGEKNVLGSPSPTLDKKVELLTYGLHRTASGNFAKRTHSFLIRVIETWVVSILKKVKSRMGKVIFRLIS